MPEGPECTRTARQVDRAIRGKKLVNLNIISGRYTKKLPAGFDSFLISLESFFCLPKETLLILDVIILFEF